MQQVNELRKKEKENEDMKEREKVLSREFIQLGERDKYLNNIIN